MKWTALHSWLKGRRTQKHSGRRGVRRRARLGVEALEVRCVPATFTVNSALDAPINHTDNATQLTLRDAIDLANTNPGADLIQFSSAAFPANQQTVIRLANGELNLTQTGANNMTTIAGPGANLVTVNGRYVTPGGQTSRAFKVESGVNALIRGLTIGGIEGSSKGGGISNSGTLVLLESTIADSTAIFGGGLFNEGSLTIRDTTIASNLAGAGGGVYSQGELTLVNCTVSGNAGQGIGGSGIYIADGTGLVRNCTIASNYTVQAGDAGSGAVAVGAGSLTLFNTIVAGNLSVPNSSLDSATPLDITGAVNSASSNNLISDPASAGGLANGVNGNIVGNRSGGALPIDAILDSTLRNNGGTTQTLALVVGSPAINSGSNAQALDINGVTPLLFEQRLVGFPRISGGTVDIGAVESVSYVFSGPITVNSTADGPVNHTDDATNLTLRDALDLAAFHAGPDIIRFNTAVFPASTVTTINVGNEPLRIGNSGASDATTIEGLGANRIVINGGTFQTSLATYAEISGLTLSRGSVSNLGHLTLSESNVTQAAGVANPIKEVNSNSPIPIGIIFTTAVLNQGAMTILDCIISENSAIGVTNTGTMTIRGSTISENSNTFQFGGVAIFGNGGGVVNAGTLAVLESTVSGNLAGAGGGIFNTGALTVRDSTFSGNTANSLTGGGGGIWTSGPLTLIESTFSGNRAMIGGGLFATTGVTGMVRDCTITGNAAGYYTGGGLGGGLVFDAGSNVTLYNTIVAGNSSVAFGIDLAGSMVFGAVMGTSDFISALNAASSNNLIGDPASAGGFLNGVNGNIVGNGSGGVLPIGTILDTTLKNNGGPTLTHALVPNSPAINAGSNAQALDTNGVTPLLFDQRLAGFSRIKAGTVDIGAFEATPVVTITATDAIAYANSSGPANQGSWTLTRTGGAAVPLTVRLNLDLLGASAADFSLAATAGGTFDGAANTFTFAAGSATGVITLTAANQGNQAAPDESVQLSLAASQDYDPASPTAGVVTIPQHGFLVTNTNDSGAGSLRQAVANANALLGPDVISFDPAAFPAGTLTTITLTGGTLSLTELGAGNTTTINGPGADRVAVSGNNQSRVLQVNYGVNALLRGLTITAGLDINASSGSGGGGGVHNDGTLLVIDSTISGNTAYARGGGLFNSPTGSLSLRDSTISGNTAGEVGGGLANVGGTLTVINTTISGNTATSSGGGLANVAGIVLVRDVTITDNRAQVLSGGGLSTTNTVITLFNTIVAGNVRGDSAAPSDIGGALSNASANNLIGDPASAGGLANGVNGNIIGNGLGGLLPIGVILDTTLKNNGGPTPTHALVPNSPALNAGSNSQALDLDGVATLLFDQRLAGFERIKGGTVDIGAFENQNSTPTVTPEQPAVTVNEGTTAQNSGAFNDPDGRGTVTLTASLGAVTQDNASGTWSWSYTSADDAPTPVTVTITATDSTGSTASTTFTLTVNIVAPSIAISGAGSVNEGATYTLTLGAVTDPGADTVSQYRVNWGDGKSDTYTTGGVKTHVYATGGVTRAITVDLTDEDGTFANRANALSVTVIAAPTVVVPGAQTAYEDVDKAITGITVGGAANASMGVTLSVSRGILTLSRTVGLTVKGNGSGTVILSGRPADLNAAMAGLVYRGSRNFGGDDALSIAISDGSSSRSGSVAISVKSAAQQASDLQAQVKALRTAGALSGLLAGVLNEALALKGNVLDVLRVDAFLITVTLYRKLGLLTSAQANALLASASTLLLSVSRR